MKKIYLSGIEKKRGKSFISTAFLASLMQAEPDTRCFKLFKEIDEDQALLLSKICGKPVPYIMTTNQAITSFQEQPQDLLANILSFIEETDEGPVSYFEGTDFQSDSDVTEFQFNLSIATQLNCDMLLIVSAKERSFEHVETLAKSALAIAKKHHCRVVGLIINQVCSNSESIAVEHFKRCFPTLSILKVIPEFEDLAYPLVSDIARSLEAEVIFGEMETHRKVRQFTIAAKTIINFLTSRANRKDALIITPDDRIDILLGSLLADQSTNYPKIAGLVLTGGERPSGTVQQIITGLPHPFPVLLTSMATYETATTLYSARFALSTSDMTKVQQSISSLQPFLAPIIIQMLNQKSAELNLTPALFLNDLVHKAKDRLQRIVLPEGHDPRILQAADYLLKRQVVELIILGNQEKIAAHCKQYNLNLSRATIIEIEHSPNLKPYAHRYYELRKHKNINDTIALEHLMDVNYFGAMMVYCGDADGMVSGAIHTTADTVRPALEIIKTKPGVERVSSVFIMCLPTRILIYGDCAINPDPDSAMLAEIAVQAATIGRRLGLNPRVALLSYSSGGSGQGASVDKVVKAMEIIRKQHPDINAEGPIQYDAAVDMEVAAKKLPKSTVAGRANVLIFPDLNTGNNTYKAVQRETGALAIGPVLLGLNKPVNDLSRGCNVQDIINTILITAIQAQEQGS